MFLGSKKGTAGIEPATAGSAILCSTAELSTRTFVVQKSDPYNFLFNDQHRIKVDKIKGPCGN